MIRHWSAIYDVILSGLNVVVVIIVGYTFLSARLNVVTKLLAEGALLTVVQKVGVIAVGSAISHFVHRF